MRLGWDDALGNGFGGAAVGDGGLERRDECAECGGDADDSDFAWCGDDGSGFDRTYGGSDEFDALRLCGKDMDFFTESDEWEVYERGDSTGEMGGGGVPGFSGEDLASVKLRATKSEIREMITSNRKNYIKLQKLRQITFCDVKCLCQLKQKSNC